MRTKSDNFARNSHEKRVSFKFTKLDDNEQKQELKERKINSMIKRVTKNNDYKPIS